MKKIIMSAIILGMSVMHVNAQGIGINATGANPDNSAMLDVASPTGAGLQMGILFPRVNLVTGITGPATHLFGVNIDPTFNAGSSFNSGLGLYRYDGTRWNRLLESTDSTMFWGTRGNTIVSGDFIGSTNSSGTLPLEFKVNNITRLTIPTNAVSGYITASNIVGFKAPASSVPATSVYSIGSSFEFGLSGNPGTSGYTALRFGTTSFLTGLNTVGVGISIAGNPTPTEVLDVDGNIFTRDKIIYQKNSVNSVEKTGKIERYWSGPIFTSGNSAYFYNESPSTNDIRFRVRRDAGGNYFFQVATSGTRSGDYNCDGINKLLPNNIATYTDVVLAVTGPDATKTFLIKKRLNTGDPTYRITMIITDQYCDVVIEAWFH